MMTVVETLDSDPKEKAPNPRVIIEKYMMKKLEIQQNQSMWIQSRRNMNERWVLWERKLMTMNCGVEQQYKQLQSQVKVNRLGPDVRAVREPSESTTSLKMA
ncbi:hypothetical protein F2Q69_00014347 [Brassica cretica]|uniref:Uncharacterized protein n=1 Tax=Brassica cretica TaxID=69181 RepID=A0A8S9QWC3_BRACR|nr:hypothetical protein F2Q69_00014347 [Brassica cretica]